MPEETNNIELYTSKIIQLLQNINDVLVKNAERETAYQTKSKFTSLEILKIDVTTTMNEPREGVTGSGMFSSPVSDVALSILSITTGATCYVMVNSIANTTFSIELNATVPTFHFSDFPIKSIYAYTSTGTARLQAVGFR